MSTQAVSAQRSARYRALGGYLVNASAPLPKVWRMLWRLGYDVFGSEGKYPEEGQVRRLAVVAKLRRTARTAKLFLGYLLRTGASVSLPVDADVGIARDSGAYKVIDFGENTLYTVMTGPGAALAIARRAQLSQRAAQHSFAPTITGVNVGAGWLSEAYVAGRHPTGFDGCVERFEELYLPLLVAFLRSEGVVATTLHAYAEDLIRRVFAPGGLLERLPDERRQAVTDLVRKLEKQIHEASDRPLPLTLSHGDYFSGNIFIADDGRRWAIDWANLGTRSPLHDLYFLVHNHCVRVLDHQGLRSTLKRDLEALRRELQRQDPERFHALAPGLTDDHVWRWVFYLECIQTPLERCTSPTERYIDSMMLRVRWFTDFERDFESGTVEFGRSGPEDSVRLPA